MQSNNFPSTPTPLLILLIALCAPNSAISQSLADTLFLWQGYSSPGQTQITVFAAPPGKDRSHVVVLKELAENTGPAIHEDLEYLVEEIGRRFGLDPVKTYWIIHRGAFSYIESATKPTKEIFLRATFRRGSTNRLGAPSWRVIGREDVENLTDRLFQ